MKKIMMMVLMMYLFSFITFAQSIERKYVYDGGEGNVYGKDHSYAEVGYVSTSNTQDSIQLNYMITQTMGVGGCDVDDVIVISFSNGENMIKKSWEEFNCDHKTFFTLNEHDLFLLKNNNIVYITIINRTIFNKIL